MAGTWKAKTKEKSEVDSGGSMTIRFDVKKGTQVIFPDLTISTRPETYRDDIMRKALDLMNSYLQAEQIPSTETIDLD